MLKQALTTMPSNLLLLLLLPLQLLGFASMPSCRCSTNHNPGTLLLLLLTSICVLTSMPSCRCSRVRGSSMDTMSRASFTLMSRLALRVRRMRTTSRQYALAVCWGDRRGRGGMRWGEGAGQGRGGGGAGQGRGRGGEQGAHKHWVGFLCDLCLAQLHDT